MGHKTTGGVTLNIYKTLGRIPFFRQNFARRTHLTPFPDSLKLIDFFFSKSCLRKCTSYFKDHLPSLQNFILFSLKGNDCSLIRQVSLICSLLSKRERGVVTFFLGHRGLKKLDLGQKSGRLGTTGCRSKKRMLASLVDNQIWLAAK